MAIRSICAFLVALLGLQADPVFAGIVATSEVVGTPQGSDFNYTVTLNNTGTTSIGTLWFGWVPSGNNFLATQPLTVNAPVGWYGYVTNNGAGDGFGIEWYAYSSIYNLAPGHSLSTFSFESADTPASLEGSSVFYPGTPTATSVVYSGTPFSGSESQFVASVTASVPEPSSLALVGSVVAAALAFGYMRRKRPLAA
jgi:PEP-CTERM motif